MGKMDVPEEKRIAEVPITSYQLSQLSVNNSKVQSVAKLSQSFITSKMTLGGSPNYTVSLLKSSATMFILKVNSFYKQRSREDSMSDVMNIFASPLVKNSYFSKIRSLTSTRTNIMMKKDLTEIVEINKETSLETIQKPQSSKIKTIGARIKLQLLVQGK